VSGLLTLDLAWAAFRHQLAGGHESQAVALLRFLQIVGGHQDRGAGIGEAVDHPPEGAPRERVDSGSGLVQEQHTGLVHDRRAERDTLLPASRQAARDLVVSSLEARER